MFGDANGNGNARLRLAGSLVRKVFWLTLISLCIASAAEGLNAWGVLAAHINTSPMWTAFTTFSAGFLALINERTNHDPDPPSESPNA